jgi:hypothetical protein
LAELLRRINEDLDRSAQVTNPPTDPYQPVQKGKAGPADDDDVIVAPREGIAPGSGAKQKDDLRTESPEGRYEFPQKGVPLEERVVGLFH